MAATTPRILPCGDAALAVEFGEAVDPRLNANVLALDARLRDARPAGIVETVPTYRSLLIHYDPTMLAFHRLAEAVLALCDGLPDEPLQGRLWRVPVVYGGAFGIDLDDVAARHALTPGELIAKHAAPVYRVYMIGFLPGFAYLGGLDPSIATSRRETPRLKTPPGTISIGGVQALVASIEAPSGWHLLGRTPMRNFMLGREPAFILEAGDRVRFEPIPAARWDALDAAAAAGEAVAELVPVTHLALRGCGPMTSLQDAGRFGWQRFGVSTSGALDRLALAAANALVGNAPGAAAVEFILMGGSFEVEGGTARVAVAGAPCRVAVGGQAASANASLTLKAGDTLALGPAERGVAFYLAVAGGFALPPVLGSLSLQPRARIGGLDGRPLEAGDRLPLLLDRAPDGPDLALDPTPLDGEAPIRVVLGPQDDYFTADGIETLLTTPYLVSREADRMGYRLSGARIVHARGFNIVSDGIVAGSVQVPGSGEPIVMMADRQTTGGYPKIATVISADLRRVAQRRAGDAIRFAAVDMVEAQRIAHERAETIRLLPTRARPARFGWPDSEALLSLNLAGAAVDALG